MSADSLQYATSLECNARNNSRLQCVKQYVSNAMSAECHQSRMLCVMQYVSNSRVKFTAICNTFRMQWLQNAISLECNVSCNESRVQWVQNAIIVRLIFDQRDSLRMPCRSSSSAMRLFACLTSASFLTPSIIPLPDRNSTTIPTIFISQFVPSNPSSLLTVTIHPFWYSIYPTPRTKLEQLLDILANSPPQNLIPVYWNCVDPSWYFIHPIPEQNSTASPPFFISQFVPSTPLPLFTETVYIPYDTPSTLSLTKPLRRHLLCILANTHPQTPDPYLPWLCTSPYDTPSTLSPNITLPHYLLYFLAITQPKSHHPYLPWLCIFYDTPSTLSLMESISSFLYSSCRSGLI